MINNNKHGYLYFYSPDEFEVNFTMVNCEDFTLNGKYSEEDKTEIKVNLASSKDKYNYLSGLATQEDIQGLLGELQKGKTLHFPSKYP